MNRFIASKLDRIPAFLRSAVDEDRIPAVGVVVGTSQEIGEAWLFGRQTLAVDGPPLREDALFLIASPTKPMVAMAIMMLVEEGRIQIADSAASYVPEFGNQGKRAITLEHLLTHSSGLPDMLPENSELRAAEAPLAEFVVRACRLKPAFPPGHGVQYQSMGYLVLGEVIRAVTGQTTSEFLRKRIFDPLEMRDTALGMSDRQERIAEIRSAGAFITGASHWNSAYWRQLGVPWGGVLSNPVDLAKWCQHLLTIQRGESGIISHASLAAMTTNQFARMPEIPEKHRRCYPWGYGWQMNWPTHVTTFGDLLSPAAYGHWGATGTVVWIDPLRDAFMVALTTQPVEPGQRWLTRLSNLVSAALA